ncbi:uncharacterized protein LOC110991365 [Pieris rapae]|uniref:uncharacterized protein LOC110991365 n=1 Tax=Pieris rapae TaxID=64459 RepID=UPI001E27A0AD|nr:uncharacterized protein LOC110991365 [Pieris rapae]
MSYRKIVTMLFFLLLHKTFCEPVTEIQLLNELPVEKLIQLKNSLKMVEGGYDNTTVRTTFENDGAETMALRAPIKRTDEDLYKKEDSKISHIFTMSVTTLAFLAFGGYLLCLIVHAMKAKQTSPVTQQPTFFVNSGIKRPQTQFASYGRKKREAVELLEPEEMFVALMRVCEGYAKWSADNMH